MNAQPTHDRASKLFSSLHSLSARTDATNKQILATARKRLDAVNQRMKALAPQVLTQPGAEDEYQALALESRQVKVVIGQCGVFL